MHALRLYSTVAASAALLLACGGGGSDSPGTAGPSSAALQIVRGVHPVLTITVDGTRQARMLIDTGTPTTLLAPGLAARGSLANLCLTKTLCLNNVPVDAYNSTYSSPQPGYYNGLIGWDILSKLVTQIDYQSGTVRFGPSSGGTSLRFGLDDLGRPQALATVGGLPAGLMLLDTGSSYVRVTDQQRAALANSFVPNGSEVSLTLSGTETTTLSTPQAVCVDTVCTSNAVLQQASWSAVGGSYFRNFNVTVDGPGGLFRFTPANAGPLVNALTRYGLQISPDDASRLLVIRTGSPAARASIDLTDSLLTINGNPVDSIGYLGAMALLEDAAVPAVRLQLKNAGVARELTLNADR